MNKLKYNLGNFLLNLDDWFAKYHIHFDLFSKDKDNHANFLSILGYKLVFSSWKNNIKGE
jgi:hypothetical protein